MLKIGEDDGPFAYSTGMNST